MEYLRKRLYALVLTAALFWFMPQVALAETKAFFSNKTSIVHELIDRIDREQKEIDIALYAFTHREVLKALDRAKDRGVEVKVILDPLSQSMAKKLDHLGTQVSIFDPTKRLNTLSNNSSSSMRKAWNKEPLMHHKFFLFHENAQGKAWVWTGSFNCTYSAESFHMENVVVMDDIDVFNAFKEQFELMRANYSALYSQAPAKVS